MRHTLTIWKLHRSTAAQAAPNQEYVPCWVSACSNGDTTLEGGFNLMTLLVTENASLTVWISSWPWPCDSSLCSQKETKVSTCWQPTFCYSHIGRGSSIPCQSGLWDVFTQSHHHVRAAEIQTLTYPPKIVATQTQVFSIKNDKEPEPVYCHGVFFPSLGYRDLKCTKMEGETFTETISQK